MFGGATDTAFTNRDVGASLNDGTYECSSSLNKLAPASFLVHRSVDLERHFNQHNWQHTLPN